MKIVQLKPSQRVQGRWLAQLEDGTLLRVGENEVLNFSLYSGKELTEEELRAITQAARKSGLKENYLMWEFCQTFMLMNFMQRYRRTLCWKHKN